MSICPEKILLLDGNDKERFSLAIMLTRFGHIVQTVSRGESALGTLGCNDYGLIIVGDELEDMSGYVFLQKLSKKICPNIIYLSGSGNADEMARILDLGIYEYVDKSVGAVKLAVIVCDFFISSLESNSPEPSNKVTPSPEFARTPGE